MQDHRDVRAWKLADALVLRVYKTTGTFPNAEFFGIVSQLRRASISTASNIVEGCGRLTDREFLQFLSYAHASAREVEYQLGLAHRLGFMSAEEAASICEDATTVCKVVNGLLRKVRDAVDAQRGRRRRRRR